MARNFEGTTVLPPPEALYPLHKLKVMNSVLWEIGGPYSFRSNDLNGLVHMLTETFQRQQSIRRVSGSASRSDPETSTPFPLHRHPHIRHPARPAPHLILAT